MSGFSQFSEEEISIGNKKFFIGGSFRFDNFENSDSPIFLSNSILISNTSRIGSSGKVYSFNPQMGIQLNSHWLIGVNFLIFNRKTELSDGVDIVQTQTRTGNSIGIFSRYLFNPENKFQIFLSPYFAIAQSKAEFISDDTFFGLFENEEKSTEWGASLGAHYLFTDWIRATTSIGAFRYLSGTSTSNGTNFMQEEDFKSSGLNFSSSSIFFGLEFMF